MHTMGVVYCDYGENGWTLPDGQNVTVVGKDRRPVRRGDGVTSRGEVGQEWYLVTGVAVEDLGSNMRRVSLVDDAGVLRDGVDRHVKQLRKTATVVDKVKSTGRHYDDQVTVTQYGDLTEGCVVVASGLPGRVGVTLSRVYLGDNSGVRWAVRWSDGDVMLHMSKLLVPVHGAVRPVTYDALPVVGDMVLVKEDHGKGMAVGVVNRVSLDSRYPGVWMVRYHSMVVGAGVWGRERAVAVTDGVDGGDGLLVVDEAAARGVMDGEIELHDPECYWYHRKDYREDEL